MIFYVRHWSRQDKGPIVLQVTLSSETYCESQKETRDETGQSLKECSRQQARRMSIVFLMNRDGMYYVLKLHASLRKVFNVHKVFSEVFTHILCVHYGITIILITNESKNIVFILAC
mmetsp:Transcript_14986/g.28199  ORF Transcript_14986/g.28199 Transcript_14986/m.28199 type:complete len:117 (+) Transcript_14986:35-385(+)